MFCIACGTRSPLDARFCGACGARFAVDPGPAHHAPAGTGASAIAAATPSANGVAALMAISAPSIALSEPPAVDVASAADGGTEVTVVMPFGT